MISRGATRTWPGSALALLLVVACADMSGPDRSVLPPMRALDVSYLSTTSGIMHVEGFPADTAFRLESGESVPIEIAVSSGDREASALYPLYCPPRRRGRPGWICFEFDIMMGPGLDVLTTNGYVAGIGGRMQTVIGNWWGRVVLFDLDGMVDKARQAQSWPGVQGVDLAPLGGCSGGGSYCFDWSQLTRPVHVDDAAARPGDGTVQVTSGDTVTVSYRQPGGGTLQVRYVVP